MARRTITAIDVVEILVHWHAGRRIGELCSSLGVDPKTVRKYTAPAVAAGLAPGGPRLSEGEWAALVTEWFPALVDPEARATTWPELEAHREQIGKWMGAVTVATMHQRLRDDEGVKASESSLRRFIWANFTEDAARDAVRVLRDTTPAGDEAQVDYGLLGRWVDPVSGRTRRVWGFIIVLTYSRLLFLRPVLSMDAMSWVEAHVAAVEFFGGCPARIVPDNLKTGVIKPDLYDPKINRSFAEFAVHYGCLIDPARVAKPRDKARVERMVPYARDSFYAGRADEFETLTAMQADAVRWSREVANARPSRALDRVAPQAVFDAEEVGLERRDLDLLHRTVTIRVQRTEDDGGRHLVGAPKTDAGRRTLVLPSTVVPEIEAHLAEWTPPEPDAPVFVGPRGGPLRIATRKREWTRVRRVLDLEQIHLHDLRHLAGTLAAATGASTKELMHRLGHASPRAALRYQHATAERDEAIADGIDRILEASDNKDDQDTNVIRIRRAAE